MAIAIGVLWIKRKEVAVVGLGRGREDLWYIVTLDLGALIYRPSEKSRLDDV